ncbi:alpha/beta hydrolase [Candidatus Woesearchaeota archaeon]|jgi:pimeloyl-ACP methyl ester carboxylesterase|nr:alpha/beta hydrolase [Candidatus Woesearchaeota archaeon]
MEGKTIRSFDFTKIFYQYHQGTTPHTLVFLHGVGGNWTVWKKEIEYFKKKGYSIIALDLRGHGLSGAPKKFKKYQLYRFTMDVYRILQKERIKNFSLVGHSIGGAIIINYCMRYKNRQPHSLVLIETASTYPFEHNHLLNHCPYVTHFLRFISEHKLTKREHFFHLKDIDLSQDGIKENINLISHLLHLTPLRSMVRSLDNLEKYVFKNQKRIDYTLKHFTGPILVIGGEKDQVVPAKYSRIIKDLNKKAHLKILKGAHHLAIVNNAEKVNHVMYNFFKQDNY